ncbi:hypothetical protein [Roseospira navarrensis]|uniref:Baseplate protein J-like domain-containing protein n=1 Tax=Roseospira navarrensis TaxID=140058 RepID=A0A7X1ZFN3_9PROT|nr:hypothetical protein [Roseospira navarrensis]MQX37646.1 hypothetical protein [Roseospira navarrensis]
MTTSADRLSLLRSRAADFTGIAFVKVVDTCDQRVLWVYFHTDPRDLATPFEPTGAPPDPLTPADLRIHAADGTGPDVPLDPDPARLVWRDDPLTAHRVLEVVVREPGAFADYRLTIDDARVDPGFNGVRFSFKVGCDDDLDCAEDTQPCPPPGLDDVEVDYLARDFVSLRNALLDFTAQRYPNWQTPTEADVGMVPLEILAALGDELSYFQDRMNREAYLETATERRSLRRKARLVDHEIHDGRQATTLLELTAVAGSSVVPAGAAVWALPDGQDPIAFEIGARLRDAVLDGVSYAIDSRWNAGLITPYAFDDDGACLMPGATEVYVRNDPADPDNPGGEVFTVADAATWADGRLLLLRDRAADVAEPERLRAVRVVDVDLTSDPLVGIALARIRWADEDAVTIPIPLADLDLSGNLLPATAGETRRQSFRLGPLQENDGPDVRPAVERAGPLYSDADPSLLTRRDPCDEGDAEDASRPPVYLLSLPDTDTRGLAFADLTGDLRATEPELIVTEDGQPDDPWDVQRSLLLCGPDDQVVTLEDGTWRRILGIWTPDGELVHRDYATGAGYTVRFGDGLFGRLPVRDALFHVDYRLGAGRRANLPAGAVNGLSIPNQQPPHVGDLVGLVDAVTNPFPVTDGRDPETAEEIRQTAPDAYRASVLFAVRPEDYGTQAETLASVQRAQGRFRWTGAWLAATTAVDPAGAAMLTEDVRAEVQTLLDNRRQAGRPVIVVPPRYVNLDLRITVCLSRTVFRGHVEPRLLAALFGDARTGATGFFAPDAFTFGTPLRRPALEAAIVAVEGVEAVTGMEIRVHGETDFAPFEDFAFDVADDELIRLENTRRHPERGSLRLTMVGGA